MDDLLSAAGGVARSDGALTVPLEPPPSRFSFPSVPPTFGQVAMLGADLEPGTILAAYRSGLLPMPVHDTIGWWWPHPRGVLPLDRLRISRSLRKSCARYEVRVDTAFTRVLAACADRSRVGHWITDEITDAYVRLHHLGWAHSIEAWSLDDGTLCGGLYGTAIGGLFAGESMFHHRTDASKVALVGLVDLLGGPDGAGQGRLLDVHWRTDHLASLGVVELHARAYRRWLERTLQLPLPPALAAMPQGPRRAASPVVQAALPVPPRPVEQVSRSTPPPSREQPARQRLVHVPLDPPSQPPREDLGLRRIAARS